MKLRKTAYGTLILALVFFSNPNFNAFDLLPDFIGAFIIATLLRRAERIVPFLAEARDAFVKLGMTSLIRVGAAMVMFSNLHTGMDIVPLFTLVFSVIELAFLYKGVLNTARGMIYLAERSDANALIKPVSFSGLTLDLDGLKNLTLVFFTLRALLNLLPQLCHLSTSDDVLRYNLNRLYAPLEISGLIIILLFGLIWLLLMLTALTRVRREGKIAVSVASLAGEEKLARLESEEGVHRIIGALSLLSLAFVASFDIALKSTDSFNVMPRFLFCAILLIAAIRLSENRRERILLTVPAVAFCITSTVGLLLTLSFSDKYSIRDLSSYTVAKEDYIKIETVAVIETVLMLAFICALFLLLSKFIKRHTGTEAYGENYTKSAIAHHRELTARVAVMLSMLAATTVLKCIQIFLIGSPVTVQSDKAVIYSARLPWFGTLIFAINFILVFYSFMLTGELKYEVRTKYGINGQ